MISGNPFNFSQPIPGAEILTAEDRRQIDLVADVAAVIFAGIAKENGFGEAEIARAGKDCHDIFTSYVVDQRSAGLEP